MPDVLLPRLSESMEEGILVRWLVGDGARVRTGDELALIETDKATTSCEAEADGVLRLVAQEGDTVAVGAVIAVIGEAAASAGSGPGATALKPGGGRLKASPVARRIARERGVDLASVSGSGPGGRIVKADVAVSPVPVAAGHDPAPAAAALPPTAPSPSRTPADRSAARGDVHVYDATRSERVVARRMAESRSTVPDFSIRTEVDMEGCVDMRGRLAAIADPVPTYNDLIVKASAIALREHPRVNGSYVDGRVESYSRVNVGIAVAAPDALVVATIFDADRKGLGTIAREARDLAARARDGAVTPAQLAGGTFTVSNLGMYGVTEFEAVVNPPQAAILAAGAIRPLPVARDGRVAIRHAMALTLVCDHRILDGASAARFLARIRALLEEPSGLAL